MSCEPRDSGGKYRDDVLAEAYKRYRRNWVALATLWVGPERAEGIVHDLWTRLWKKKRADLDTPEAVDRLVVASIPNRSRDHHRRVARWTALVARSAGAGSGIQSNTTDTTGETHVRAEELLQVLLSALDCLRPSQQEAVILRLLGRTTAEIASLQETAVATARTRLARAQNSLQEAVTAAFPHGVGDGSTEILRLLLKGIGERFGSLKRL